MSTITTEEPGDQLLSSKRAMKASTVDDENSSHRYNEALAKMRTKYSKQRKCPIRQRSIFKKSRPKSKATRQKGAKFIEMIKTNLEAVPKKVISSEDIKNMTEAMVERMTYYNRREESGELSAEDESNRKTLGECMRQVWLILAKRFGEIDAEADERIAKIKEKDSSGNIADEILTRKLYGQDIKDRICRNRETMRADDVTSANLQPDPSTAPDNDHHDSPQQ